MESKMDEGRRGNMAGYVLHLSTEENITLSSATVKRLIAGGSGDAALLYLAILHARGAADSGKLARELKWDETRLRAAEQALYEMKLVGAPEKKEEAPLPPPQQLSEPPEYTREDIARKLEGDGRFACLLREVEHKLGPLSTPSVKKLLGAVRKSGSARGRGLHARQLLHREKGAAVRRGAAAQHARDRKKRATSGRARSSFPSKRPAST